MIGRTLGMVLAIATTMASAIAVHQPTVAASAGYVQQPETESASAPGQAKRATPPAHAPAAAAPGAPTAEEPGRRPVLPPVTEHPLHYDFERLASGSNQAVQIIQVRVIGGELRVDPTSVTVELHRAGDRLVGTLPAIRVVDARGTLEGWTVRYRLHEVVEPRRPGQLPPGWVTVAPRQPTVIAGLEDGLRAGRTSTTGKGHHELMGAVRGAGGGTYEGGGEVTVRLPPRSDLEHAELVFVLDVA